MSYEMVLQAKENSKQLDPFALLSCLTKYLQLLGNVNDYIFSKRRPQVLTKIGQISSASFTPRGKQRFPRGTFCSRTWQRGDATNYYKNSRGRSQFYRPTRSFRGRGRGTSTFSQSTPRNQI